MLIIATRWVVSVTIWPHHNNHQHPIYSITNILDRIAPVLQISLWEDYRIADFFPIFNLNADPKILSPVLHHMKLICLLLKLSKSMSITFPKEMYRRFSEITIPSKGKVSTPLLDKNTPVYQIKRARKTLALTILAKCSLIPLTTRRFQYMNQIVRP